MAALPLHQPASAPELGPTDRNEAKRWLVIAALGIVVGAVVALVLEELGIVVARAIEGGTNPVPNMAIPPVWYVAMGFFGVWFGMGAAAVAAVRQVPATPLVQRFHRRLGLAFHRHDVFFIFLGPALQLVLSGVYYVTGADGSSTSSTTKASNLLLGGGHGWLLVVPAAFAIVCAPFFEELFFRGVLLRGLLSVLRTRPVAIGVIVSVALDGTLFGFAHLGTDDWIELPALAIVGIVLCVLALWTKRLGPSIMTHASFNAVAVLLVAWSR